MITALDLDPPQTVVHDGRFTTPDGPALHFRDYSALGEVTGPPVLCLHGLTRNVLDFSDLAPRLAGLGRRVIAVSQRGRGLSDRDAVADRYVLPTYVDDTLALLDHLEIERAVFVGTSMGGLMTMLVALAAPGRIAGAVLNDIAPEIEPEGLARIGTYVGAIAPVASWEEAAQHCRAVHRVAFPGEDGAHFWLDFARRTHRQQGGDGSGGGSIVLDYDPAIATTLGKVSGPTVDWWSAFDALAGVPTLVVRGALSDILSAHTVSAMAARRPDLRRVETGDVGHAPYLTEADTWQAVAELVGACSV